MKSPSILQPPLWAYGKTRRRRGAVLIAALVCLVVVMGLVGGMLQSALRAHRHLRSERDLRQTELLLQAGLERAAFRLANEPEYSGETWTLPAAEIVGHGAGKVTIEVSQLNNQQSPQVHIVAEYPVGSERSIRRSSTLSIQTQSQEP